MTVRGAIHPAHVGVTLMHEHLFHDLSNFFRPGFETPATDVALGDHALGMENANLVRDYKPIRDAYGFTDERLAMHEAWEFRLAGGNTFVDVTSKGMKPDPLALRRASYATGLNIVMGTGWYSRHFHPEDMDQRTIEDLADEIIHDITMGVGETGIRSEIIGEVGVDGEPLRQNELKSLRAAARASRATGAAITIHYGGLDREKLEVLRVAEEEGAETSRMIMGHTDIIAGDLPLMIELLERGANVEFDLLGKLIVPLSYRPIRRQIVPRRWSVDAQDVEAIRSLIEAGYEDRILLSHDLFPKMQFKSYGGTGYAFILEKFLPHLRSMGVTEECINKFMIENPRRILTFVPPK